MGFYRGPNIVTDGLKMYYDSVNTKCFRGEPTTNQANTDALRTITPYAGVSVSSDAPERGADWKKVVISSISSNYRICKFPYIMHPIGTKTYSIEYDFNGCVGYYWRIDGSTASVSGDSGNSFYDDGYRRSVTYTKTADGSESFFLNNNIRINTSGFTDTIYYRNYQVEQKSYSTPYTDSVRGLTPQTGGGLLDLSRNNINGSFMSSMYDGGGSLLLNGGSIHSAHNYVFDEYTVSVWFNASNNTIIEGYGRTIFSTSTSASVGNVCWITLYGKNFRVYSFSWYDNAYHLTTGDLVELDTWYNITVSSFKGGILNVFLDGVLISQSTSNNMNSSSTSFTIGDLRDNRNINFLGKIGQTMFYNRVLNPNEIKQNYDASKQRYKL